MKGTRAVPIPRRERGGGRNASNMAVAPDPSVQAAAKAARDPQVLEDRKDER